MGACVGIAAACAGGLVGTGVFTCDPSIDRIMASAILIDAAAGFVTGAVVLPFVVEFSNGLKRFTNDGV
jgi:hypothetical protein